ncbi:MAG TPA: hypothetical protein VGO52_10505 [Hyphomonadaceae bacterium]|nr:hypothetical protein [Hyphomonadaceae bacterium]
MRSVVILAGLALAACQPAAKAGFDVAGLKPGDDMATLTGWYAFSGRSREFRLYPTNGDLKAVGKGQCISGVATSLAGVPPETLEGKKVVITGNLFAPDSPDIGATANDCGAGAILVAMDISYADEK